MEGAWRIEGFDIFEEELYPIGDDERYPDEKAARRAATDYFRMIEELQPKHSSGGQADDDIQDQIFIIRPDGTRYRFLPLPG